MTTLHTVAQAAIPAAQPGDADALRLADAIDPFTRKAAPDHLTSKVAADALRRLAAQAPAVGAPAGFVLFPAAARSDVLTAAGLVRHGKQCKALADRLGEAVAASWNAGLANSKPQATAALLPLPLERIEFGLNCNLEDPTHDETNGFYAGVAWAEHCHGIKAESKPPVQGSQS